MIKKFIILVIFIIFMSSGSATCQDVYVAGETLGISSNSTFGVHGDLILDSAVIIGEGDLVMAKDGRQTIYSCHSEIPYLVVTSSTILSIVGDLKVYNYTRIDRVRHHDQSYPDSTTYHVEADPPKKMAEKQSIEEKCPYSGIRPTNHIYFALMGVSRTPFWCCNFEKRITYYNHSHNTKEFKIEHYIPPETSVAYHSFVLF
jgi:hypothetical protein